MRGKILDSESIQLPEEWENTEENKYLKIEIENIKNILNN